MATHNVARRAYSAEQLLALRMSATDEPALSMENETHENSIKDHVLRATRSCGGRSSSAQYHTAPTRTSTDGGIAPSASVLGEIHQNNQTIRPLNRLRSSPTPSLTKQRAEMVLRQHGSPPGLRVTAGGRIVTSEQSPLCSPRYGYSAINKNGGLIRFAPGYPPPPHTFENFAKSLPNGFVAQDPNGKLCQMVDGRFIPINEVNGVPQLFITAPNLTSIPPEKAPYNGVKQRGSDRSNGRPSQANGITAPSAAVQVNALEKQYQKLETERRALDKAEVLQRGAMTSKGYNQLISKRRELVRIQDEIRRNIKTLQDMERASDDTHYFPRESTNPPGYMVQPPSMLPPSSYGGWTFDGTSASHAMPQPMFWTPSVAPDMSMFMPSPNFEEFVVPQYGPVPMMAHIPPLSHPGAASQTHVNDALAGSTCAAVPNANSKVGAPREPPVYGASLPTTTGPTQIAEQAAANRRSGLNPMSAVYEPTKAAGALQSSIDSPEHALAEAVRAHNAWAEGSHGPVTSPKDDTRPARSQSSSECSFTTADFFPHAAVEQQGRAPAPIPRHVPDVPLTKRQAITITTPRDDRQHRQHALVNKDAAKSVERSANQSTHDDTLPQVPQDAPDRSLTVSPKTRRDTEAQTVVPTVRACATSMPSPTFADDAEHTDGFKAGLVFAKVDSAKSSKYLDGYCAGLKAAISLEQPAVVSHGSTGESVDTTSKESTISKCLERRIVFVADGSAILQLKPTDKPSQAMLSPPDENVLLSATASQRTNEVILDSIMDPVTKAAAMNQSAHMISPREGDRKDTRTFSAQTQPNATLQASYTEQRTPTGHRIFSSPTMDWKSSPSMVKVAGMTTSVLGQFDGSEVDANAASAGETSSIRTPRSVGKACITQADDMGSPKTRGFKSPRFHEEKMPESGELASPTASPLSLNGKRMSPAKAKLAQMASRAGSKVRDELFGPKESEGSSPLQMSPQERRKWRDMWKKKQHTD